MSDAPSLLERIQGLIEKETFALPVFSETAFRLRSMTAKDCDLREVESVIIRDQALASEVLRVANSAFYRGLSEISTIRSAVMRIGLKEVIKIVSIVSERSKYEARDPMLIPMVRGLWQQTFAASLAADWTARKLNHKGYEEVFLAGLLHDIGELVLIRALDELKTQEGSRAGLSPELVEEVLVTAHAVTGFNYLNQRRIPEVYCRIARDHHQSTFDPQDTVMALVRLADLAVRKVGISLDPDPELVLTATSEAACLNTSEILLAELEIMLEDFVASPVTN